MLTSESSFFLLAGILGKQHVVEIVSLPSGVDVVTCVRGNGNSVKSGSFLSGVAVLQESLFAEVPVEGSEEVLEAAFSRWIVATLACKIRISRGGDFFRRASRVPLWYCLSESWYSASATAWASFDAMVEDIFSVVGLVVV